MKNGTDTNRREFLKTGASIASIAGAVALLNPFTRAIAASCGIATPPQAKGPFYPGETRFGQGNDLTRVPGSSGKALGQVVYVRGRVVDASCNPVAGANVEIWQACASGRYNHSRDPNSAPLDPNFRYWAEVFTDENGEYIFKTIIPGAYPADEAWDRPPHIHFRIARLQYRELITQMYFKGNPLNDKDLILQEIPDGQRQNVIVDFQPSPAGFEPGSLMGSFEITLQKIARTAV